MSVQVSGLSKGSKSISSELVGDSKEGIVSGVAKQLMKRRVLWSGASSVVDAGETNIGKRVKKRKVMNSSTAVGVGKVGDSCVITIPDEDASKLSEGVVAEVDLAVDTVIPGVSRPAGTSEGVVAGESHPSVSESSSVIFRPEWKLTASSLLSLRPEAVEFACHAFPPASISEMDTTPSPRLIQDLRYAAARSAAFLTAGARRIERLLATEVESASVKARAEEMQGKVEVLERKVRGLEDKLRGQVRVNEGLSVRVESLEQGLADKEVHLQEKVQQLSVALSSLTRVESDLDWLVKEGVVRVVDRVIESPAFGRGLSEIKCACLAAGEERGRVLAESGEDEAALGASELAVEMDRVIEDFAMLDFASFLRLGDLSVGELRDLCRDEVDGGADDVGVSAGGGLEDGPSA